MEKVKIEFTKDWQELVSGELRPGVTVEVVYDNARLPEIRDTYNGMPTWSILNFVKFNDCSECREKALETPGEGELMTQTFKIPKNSQEIEMWFENTGRSGRVAWDSDYSQNYIFRFPKNDIKNVDASVNSMYPTPYSSFTVYIDTDKIVDNINIKGTVRTKFGTEDIYINQAHKEEKKFENGFYLYQTVPYMADVEFEILYWINGRKFVDNNNGKMYKAKQNVE